MTRILSKPHVHVDYGWRGRDYLPGEVDYIMNRPDMLVVPCWSGRIGVVAFAVQLEYEFFPPVGPVNDLLHLAHIQWPEANGDPANKWSVIAVPMQFRSIVEYVAEQNSMRLANGVPTMLERQANGEIKTTFFRYKGNNVYNLENEAESAVYDNKPTTREQLFAIEMMRVQDIRDEFREKYALYLTELQRRQQAGLIPDRPVGRPLSRQERRDRDRRKNR